MDEKAEKKYFNEIKKIERDYYSITAKFDLSFPKILNIDSEKKKFFDALANNKIYNPQFEYIKKEFDLERIEQLNKFKIDLSNDYFNIKRLYAQRIRSKIYEVKCHQNWGDVKSTDYVLKYRGQPNLSLLNRAIEFCLGFEKKKFKVRNVTAMQVGESLNDEVERLTGEKIKVDYVLCMANKMNIMPYEKTIKINSSEVFTTLDVERLKVHEIGVHYMRYFNAKRINIKLLQKGTSNYVETEEGLAVYFEELKGVSSNSQMQIYAGRVIATYYALRMSFYNVFMMLKEYGFSDSNAFNITARAKRNLCDTSLPGGFTKDYVYLKGYYRVKRYAKKHDLRDLFIGKIKLEDVYLLKGLIERYSAGIICNLETCPRIIEEESEESIVSEMTSPIIDSLPTSSINSSAQISVNSIESNLEITQANAAGEISVEENNNLIN